VLEDDLASVATTSAETVKDVKLPMDVPRRLRKSSTGRWKITGEPQMLEPLEPKRPLLLQLLIKLFQRQLLPPVSRLRMMTLT
jgi:hypothetical protein